MERIYVEITHSKDSKSYGLRAMWSSPEYPGTVFNARDRASCAAPYPLGEQELHEVLAAVRHLIESWQFIQDPLF